MLSGENDTPEIAQELADLIKPRNKLSYVNLIPYNPVAEHIKYERSTRNDTAKFYDVLKKNGINCVVRQEHGTDIDAACGQLRSKQIRKTKKSNKIKETSTKAQPWYCWFFVYLLFFMK